MSVESKRFRMDTVDEDRISDLPPQLIDFILSFLPIRDVVRTSVLSTKWRYQWATVPKLVFKQKNPYLSTKETIDEKSRLFARIINHVLLLHRGPIEVFHIIDTKDFGDVGHWVFNVSTRGIKDFMLKLQCLGYVLHSSLYDSKSLINLKLFKVSLRPPLNFSGWPNLKSLHLEDVDLSGMTADAFEKLISSSPSLEKLALIRFGKRNEIHINARHLQYIHLKGFFRDITFGCKLTELVVLSTSLQTDPVESSVYEAYSLNDFFINLPHIRRLTLRGSFMSYLSLVRLIPDSMHTPRNDLYYLEMSLDTGDVKESLIALYLFNSSPNLLELEIKGRGGYNPNPSIWADSSKVCCEFGKLRLVELVRIMGAESELELIKLVLAKSPVLEKMTIHPSSETSELELLKAVVRFKRASPKAEIIFV